MRICPIFAGPVTYARTYPAAIPKGVADLCLCQLPTMYVQMHVHTIFSPRMNGMIIMTLYVVDSYVYRLKQRSRAVNMMIKMTIK